MRAFCSNNRRWRQKKESIYDFIDSHDRQNIESLKLPDRLCIWGVMNNNAAKFRKIEKDDLVLFTANNIVEAYGRVVYTLNNSRLARFLWGQDEFETWDNIYIIDDFHNAADFLVKELNKALGYQENNVVQGFTVIDDRSRLNGFFRKFNYTNGILTLEGSNKTTASLAYSAPPLILVVATFAITKPPRTERERKNGF